MADVSKRLSPGDPNSYSRPDEVKVLDMFIKLDADVGKHIMDGYVTLTVEKINPSATTLLLDSRNLTIKKILHEANETALPFALSKPSCVGSKLEIDLPKSPSQKIYKIKIYYETEKDCRAIQWMPPELTTDKTHPYFFSQCQALLCRSMIPCQDTPGLKSTYRAEITAPEELTVLMSAVRQEEPIFVKDGKRLHKFNQKIPIPSYLMAIAAGKLESRKIGPRTVIWSEKSLLDKAAHDFSETETMLQIGEDICGPYIWGEYDIVVMPPSFPFAGMENPCMMFISPTVITGDKSLSSVIAHEIAHCWAGNLVTNSNFEHFWLNEGFTVMTERKIRARHEGGEPSRQFDAMGGWKTLQYMVKLMGEENPLTSLIIDLTGIDPDGAYSIIPYEKGFAFLWYLEELVGGSAVFEKFMKAYYEHFKYKSIDSTQFKTYFTNYFDHEKDIISNIDWDVWFYKRGMPTKEPTFDLTLAKGCLQLKHKWISWDESTPCPFEVSEFNTFSSAQKIGFLAAFLQGEPLSFGKLKKMGELYSLNNTNNSELKFLWIRLGLKSRCHETIPKAIAMISEQGRMKFLRPLYRDLFAWEDSRDIVLKAFQQNKKYLMKVSVMMLESDLGLAK